MSADNQKKNCTEGPNCFLHSHWKPFLIIVCELKILQAHMSENVHTWRVCVVQSSSSSLGGNTEMVWLDVGQSLMVCRLDMHALTWYFGERVTWFCVNSKIVLVCLLTDRRMNVPTLGVNSQSEWVLYKKCSDSLSQILKSSEGKRFTWFCGCSYSGP